MTDSLDKSSKLPEINKKKLGYVFSNKFTLPNPLEQADNLLRYVGKQSKDFGAGVALCGRNDIRCLQFVIGAHKFENVSAAAELLVKEGVFHPNENQAYSLTTEGWRHYRYLEEAKTVFIAMDFGNNDVKEFRNQCLKIALEEDGYKPIIMDEYDKPGEITDQIRNGLRRAQIVIADLTENNQNVHWEAGFAEGSNKLVIYTCEEKFFDCNEMYFNTKTIRIITWKKDSFDKTRKRIKDTIKNAVDSKF